MEEEEEEEEYEEHDLKQCEISSLIWDTHATGKHHRDQLPLGSFQS